MGIWWDTIGYNGLATVVSEIQRIQHLFGWKKYRPLRRPCNDGKRNGFVLSQNDQTFQVAEWLITTYPDLSMCSTTQKKNMDNNLADHTSMIFPSAPPFSMMFPAKNPHFSHHPTGCPPCRVKPPGFSECIASQPQRRWCARPRPPRQAGSPGSPGSPDKWDFDPGKAAIFFWGKWWCIWCSWISKLTSS